MNLSTFAVTVFCLADDWPEEQHPLRRRGPRPKLSDSGVLTVEVVGEFLSLDTDRGLYRYFRSYYAERSPILLEVPPHHLLPPSSEPVGCQGEALAGDARPRPSLPRPLSGGRLPGTGVPPGPGHRCRRSGPESAFSHDEVNKGNFLRAWGAPSGGAWPGVMVALASPRPTPSRWPMGCWRGRRLDVGEQELLESQAQGAAPRRAAGVGPAGPYKTKKGEKRPWPRWLGPV